MRLGDMTLDQVQKICHQYCRSCPLNFTALCEEMPDEWDLDMEVEVEVEDE